MIEWIKKKFASILTLGFVIYVSLFGIAGFITGLGLAVGIGSVGIGIVICLALGTLGVFLGLFFGILIFGLFAVIINISDSNEAILKKLNEMAKNTSNASITSAAESKE